MYVFPPAQDGVHQGGRGTLSDDWATIHARVPLRDHAFCSYLNTKWLSPLGSDCPRQAEFVDEDPLHSYFSFVGFRSFIGHALLSSSNTLDRFPSSSSSQ